MPKSVGSHPLAFDRGQNSVSRVSSFASLFFSLQIKKSNRASHDRRFVLYLQRRVAMSSPNSMALESDFPCRKFLSRWVLFNEGDESGMSIYGKQAVYYSKYTYLMFSISYQPMILPVLAWMFTIIRCK